MLCLSRNGLLSAAGVEHPVDRFSDREHSAYGALHAADRRGHPVLAQGKDLYLFFKHEETPDGALYAEELAARL